MTYVPQAMFVLSGFTTLVFILGVTAILVRHASCVACAPMCMAGRRDSASDINTFTTYLNLRLVIGEMRLFLVASVGHKRRAVGVFRKQGILPVPARTGYQPPEDRWHAAWTTTAVHLQDSDVVFGECLGLAWYGRTDRS